MSDGDCCMLFCCCCALCGLCNTAGTHPFCFPRSCNCFRYRRSKYDDDKFIDEVLQDNERRRAGFASHAADPEAGYHIRQPEPVAQMNMQYPPKRSSSQQHPSTRSSSQQYPSTRSPSQQQQSANRSQWAAEHPESQKPREDGGLVENGGFLVV